MATKTTTTLLELNKIEAHRGKAIVVEFKKKDTETQ